jgi:acetyl-CoA synthetase
MAGAHVWKPSSSHLTESNIARFMRRHAIGSYDELIKKSTDDIGWFWDAVVADLPIEFFHPYDQVFDMSAGVPWTRWFVGGTINLAYNCLDRHALSSTSRDRAAIVWEGEDGEVRTWTYRELFAETNGIGNAMSRLGVGRGDRVGLFLTMLPEAVAAFLACAKIGAVAIPIFSGYGAEAVAARLNDGEAKLLITSQCSWRKGKAIPMLEVAGEAADRSPSIKHVIAVNRGGPQPLPRPVRDLWWDDAVATESSELASVPLDSETPFLIAYTSGTTGRPKGAVHVHGGLVVKIAQEVRHQVDMTENDRLFWVTDLGWIMGPWELIGGFAAGGTVVLFEGAPDHPAPDRLWALIERHKVSILGISPTLIRALMRHSEQLVQVHDLSSLRILASTGEPWNPDPWMWYFEHVGGGRCPIINISGGTEVGACFLSPLPITPLKPCTLAGPALGMAVDVWDSDGKPVRGSVGELVCTKPWPGMTRGIWNDPDRYLQTYWSRWPDVWVHGDWASIDEDGQWTLHGRSDDTIKVSGKRLGPAEIESILVAHPAVAESAAIGVPHQLKGEVAWAFVILRNGFEPTESLRSELTERVCSALGKSFAPEKIAFVRELPKTRNAKILRRAIRAAVLGQDPGDLSSLENPGALEEVAGAI